MEITVAQSDVRQRLDVFVVRQLAQNYPDISRQRIAQAIRDEDIAVNNRAQKPQYRVRLGDVIGIDENLFAQSTPDIVADTHIVVPIIFAHKHFFVVNKPVGMQVHPSEKHEQETLVHGILARDPTIASVGDDMQRPGIVHRLDRDTSGLIVVARTQEAFDALKQEFQNHRVTKQYYTIAQGTLPSVSGSIDFPIARHRQGNRQVAVRTAQDRYRGVLRDAYTEYQVIRQYDTLALLSVQIRTGRTHQIRVHLSKIGHPIVGDQLYGSKNSRQIAPHQFLHAHLLSFRLFAQSYCFSAPLPHQWAEILTENR